MGKISKKLKRRFFLLPTLGNTSLLEEYRQTILDIDYEFESGLLTNGLCEYSNKIEEEIFKRMMQW